MAFLVVFYTEEPVWSSEHVLNMYWAVALPFPVGYHIIEFQLEDGEVNPVFWIAIQEQQMSLTCALRCMDDFENLL